MFIEANYSIFPGLRLHSLSEWNASGQNWKKLMSPVPKSSKDDVTLLGALRAERFRRKDACLTTTCPPDSLCHNIGGAAECHCTSEACKNHGQCSVLGDRVTCACEAGFFGPRCASWRPTAPPKRSEGGSLPVTVTAALSGLAAFSLLLLAVVCWRRRRWKRRKMQSGDSFEEEHLYGLADNPPPSEYEYAESLYEDPDTYAYTDVYDDPGEPYTGRQDERRTATSEDEAAPPLPERSAASSQETLWASKIVFVRREDMPR